MKLKITAGPFIFDAVLETARAPKTCEAFIKQMPFDGKIVHVRWSGEGVWIPLGDHDFGVGYENHTSHPAPGHIILYPGASAKRKSCLPTEASIFHRKWANWLAIISSQSHPISTNSPK